MRRASTGVQLVCTWIQRLAWANLLWWGTTLAGGVVLGVFPATLALVELVGSWFDPEEAPWRASSFFRSARRHAIRANALGYLMTAFGMLLAADLWLVSHQSGAPALAMLALSSAAAGLYLVTLIHLPFVATHWPDDSVATQLRSALWLGLSHPLGSLLVAAAYVALSLALGRYPGLALFFSTSPVCALTVWLDTNRVPAPQAMPSSTGGLVSTPTNPEASSRERA